MGIQIDIMQNQVNDLISKAPSEVREKIGQQYMPMVVYAKLVYTFVEGTGYYDENLASQTEIKLLFDDTLNKLLSIDPELPSKYEKYLEDLENLHKG